MKKFVINIGLLLLSVTASLALAEVALRYVEGDASAGESQVAVVYDPRIGWRHPPGHRALFSTPEYRTWVTYNAHGFRGPEVEYEKPRGTRRVLLLGDSFAEGYTVDGADVVSAVLARLLSARGGARYEVINAGVAGYSTDQQYLLYRAQGWRYRPDVTVLLFYVNDVWFNARPRYWRGRKPQFKLAQGQLQLSGVPVPPPVKDDYPFTVEGQGGIGGIARRTDTWFALHSAVYRLARQGILKSPLFNRWLVKAELATVRGEFRPWRRTPDRALQEAWTITEAILVELRERVERDGGTFLVMHVPARAAVYTDAWRATEWAYAMSDAEWSPSREAEVLAEICGRRGLRCVFPLERFRREARRHPDQQLYFPLDGHWTSAGHRLAATVLAETIGGLLDHRKRQDLNRVSARENDLLRAGDRLESQASRRACGPPARLAC